MSVVAIIMVLMYVLQIACLQQIYEITKQAEVKHVQKQMLKQLNSGNIRLALNNVMGLARENDIYVEIYDENKEVIMSPYLYMKEETLDFNKRYPFNNLVSQYTMTKFIDRLEAENKNSLIVKVTQRDDMSTLSIVLVDKFMNDNNKFYLITSSALTPMSATTELLEKIYIIVFSIVIIVSIIVALLLTISYTRPLRKLSNAAKAVTAGDYSVTIENKYDDELGLLIEDFNNMTIELSKMDILKKDLIANVSHELRTPLTMIKGYAETIRDLTGDKPDKREKQLDVIINESDRLSNLITNMLDLSKLQASKAHFEPTEYNLSEQVCQMISRYDIFKDQGYVFNTKIDADIRITGDKDRINQAICNLIDNAINHSIENKEIFISLTNNEETLFKVTNFGDVIEKEHLPHIWDRYYKVDKVGNRRVAGTGIGLCIVKEILLSHNFKFGVSSDAEKGTTFWIKFN
jgi:signal transduction histidine kinase